MLLACRPNVAEVAHATKKDERAWAGLTEFCNFIVRMCGIRKEACEYICFHYVMRCKHF